MHTGRPCFVRLTHPTAAIPPPQNSPNIRKNPRCLRYVIKDETLALLRIHYFHRNTDSRSYSLNLITGRSRSDLRLTSITATEQRIPCRQIRVGEQPRIRRPTTQRTDDNGSASCAVRSSIHGGAWPTANIPNPNQITAPRGEQIKWEPEKTRRTKGNRTRPGLGLPSPLSGCFLPFSSLLRQTWSLQPLL